MKTIHRLEEIVGIGPVSREDGTVLRTMRYDLTIYQEFDHGLAGLKSIEGGIELEGFEGFDLVGESLTLHLEDGRVLPFFVVNSNGEIAARGALREAAGS